MSDTHEEGWFVELLPNTYGNAHYFVDDVALCGHAPNGEYESAIAEHDRCDECARLAKELSKARRAALRVVLAPEVREHNAKHADPKQHQDCLFCTGLLT